MKVKNRILIYIFIVFLCGWTFFITYIYNNLIKNFTQSFEETGRSEVTEVSVIIEKNKQSLIDISDNITNLIFKDDQHINYSYVDIKNHLDQLWDIFKEKHRFMSLNYYDSNNRLIKSWGPLKGISERYSPNQEKTKMAFENTKGVGYFSCEEICYYHVSKKIHPSSFGYGILNFSIPIENIMYDYAKTNSLNLSFSQLPSIKKPYNINTMYFTLDNIEFKKINNNFDTIKKRNKAYFISLSSNTYFLYKFNYHEYPNSNFFISRNVSQNIANLEKTLYKIMFGSLLLTFILFGTLYCLLHRIIFRLQLLTNILPDIGLGNFNSAEIKLSKVPANKNNLKKFDEIDILWQSIQSLNKKLNTLHKNLHNKNKKLQVLANFDSMTGILNRRKYTAKLAQAIKNDHPFFLINIDVNKFKIINDTFGHAEGDILLIQIADIFVSAIRPNDFVGRMGGDEFAIVIQGSSKQNLFKLLEKIVGKVSQIKVGKQPTSLSKISLAIGTARYPYDSKKLDELNALADAAMYENKKDKKYLYNYYTGNEKILKEENIVNYWNQTISLALEKNLIVPFFQPIFSAKTGGIFSYEVLARIKKEKETSSLSAESFITYAEDTELIVEIDRSIINKALGKISIIHPTPIIMINISHRTLASQNIEIYILESIKNHQLSIKNIVFEITESSEIKDFNLIKEKIIFLQSKGIRFALDDFGSGYASLNYLGNLPLNFIKIDRLIIKKLLNKDKSSDVHCQILNSVINIAQAMQAEIIVEGIDSLELFNKVSEFNVDMLQGYLFAKPQETFSVPHDTYSRATQSNSTFQ